MRFLTLPRATFTTTSTGNLLANSVTDIGVRGREQAKVLAADGPFPSQGGYPTPRLQPGERPFDGPQEDPTMTTMPSTGTPAAGRKLASHGRSPSGVRTGCWHTVPTACA